MMVTLAALSLVRERMQGTIEMFRVSPLNAIQVLVGKYLGYTLMASLILAVLVPLMVYGLGVPFPIAQLGQFALISLLVTVASLGWGFLISAVVTSDSQAVQFSMLLLLMSVFFSGFFIPLKSFISVITYIANILPVTHGIQSFQSIMLLNQPPPLLTYAWLAGIALVSFLLSWLVFRRQFKRQ
jgi:ABC-2 type transport system permease protein